MDLEKFFNPKSVSIIGASREKNKIGHIILKNFVDGFHGKIYPINPKADTILGLKCYKSVLDVRGKIDLAVVCVPAKIVPTVLEDCGRKGIKDIIIITAGFKEVGNFELEKEIEKIIKKYKLRVIGPNCIGIYDPKSGVDTIFNPKSRLGRPESGSIGFISQSGATMSIVLDWMSLKGYKISKAISYGNAIDIDESDLMKYLSHNKDTKTICMYIEGVKNGGKFLNVAKRIKKPIVVLKGGKTKTGASSAKTHTGSMAGNAKIFSGALKQANVIEVEDLEEMFDLARILSKQPLPKGNRVQIITDGGGFGVLASDWADKLGLKIAKMSEANIEKLRKVIPKYAVTKNIIDLTGDVTSDMYELSVKLAVEDKNVDMIALILLFQPPMIKEDVVDKILRIKSKKPIAIISAGGKFTEKFKKRFEENGIPCFTSPMRGIKALKILYDFSQL
ncbi:MAG: CoA-binding protein [Candidatus Aenigmarchaeota archaeon]|nr:CoA-binding protein [Candidatus Aenigmarchaeota archaeon]